MSDSSTDDLCAAYETQWPAQESFTASLLVLCQTILESNDIEIAAIESRTKSLSSFRDKITRPDKIGKYESLADITDLSGVRIILFLKEDCDQAIECLSKEMTIDVANSTDKNFADDPDRFGYTSRHLVVSHAKKRSSLTEYSKHHGLKAEIQVRTVLQHAWAAIDWRLRYKSKNEVPTAIRRRLYRISALLESADEEFSSIELEVGKLREDYKEKMKNSSSEIELNAESLRVYLEEDKLWKKIRSKLESDGVKFLITSRNQPTRLSLVLDLMKSAGYNNIGDIKRDISAHEDKIEKVALRTFLEFSQTSPKVISPEGLFRIAIIAANADKADDLLQGIKLNPAIVRALKAALIK